MLELRHAVALSCPASSISRSDRTPTALDIDVCGKRSSAFSLFAAVHSFYLVFAAQSPNFCGPRA